MTFLRNESSFIAAVITGWKSLSISSSSVVFLNIVSISKTSSIYEIYSCSI